MPSVYKYFSEREYAESFLTEGTVFFQSLSHFAICEEEQLRDEHEGVLSFRPIGGLKLDLASGGHISHQGTFLSRAKNAHRHFVFCTSLECSRQLALRFKAKHCLEISDLEEFGRRLRVKMRDPVQRLKNTLLLESAVKYVDENTEPGIEHALPEKIVFRKSRAFENESEYRFAFGLDANAFDAYNVEYTIDQHTPVIAKPSKPRIIKIGSLLDICSSVQSIS